MQQEEFQEIAHCGGKIIIHVVTGENGHRGYQLTITHDRPNRSALFAVYAIPQGVAVGTIQLGGIGQPWNSPPIAGCYPVCVASDSEGMFGHQCPACNGYWRSNPGSLGCPYCGIRLQAHQFLTAAQQRYVAQFCERMMEALSNEKDGDYVIDWDAVADAAGKEGEKPPFYYAEKQQQHKFKCEQCGQVTDILGTYGYCSACGTRNDLQQLEGQIKRLRDRINGGGQFEACAKDAVAAFDSFAGQYAKQLVAKVLLTPARKMRFERMRFHNLGAISDEFRTVFGIDILSDLNNEDVKFATRMFHRRHVYEHNGGEADEKYIADSGDTDVRPKQALRETQESAHRIASLILHIASNLHNGFHSILLPDNDVIGQHSKS